MESYPVDSVIQSLNNWGLDHKFKWKKIGLNSLCQPGTRFNLLLKDNCILPWYHTKPLMKHYVSIFFLGGGGWRCFSLKYIFVIFNFVFFIQPNYNHFQNLNINSGCTETLFMISVEKIKHRIAQFLLILITWRNYFKQWYIIGVERSYLNL